MDKRKLTRSLLVVFIVLGCFYSGFNGFARQFHGSMTFSMGFPQGEFKGNIDNNTALGLDLAFGVQLGKSPFMIGIDLGIMDYGSDKRYETLYNAPEYQFEVEHDYNILQGLVFLRYQVVKTGPVRPYIDALAGINYLWTDTSLGDDDENEQITLTVDYDDFAFSYGVGGGMLVKLGKKKKRGVEFFIDMRARYIFGGKAEYLAEGSIIVENQEVTYLSYETRSDLLTLQNGFSLNFN